MKPVDIVVLGKYWDVFKTFLETVEKFEPNTPKIFVQDGSEISSSAGDRLKNWQVIQGPPKFSMAGNGNLGLKAVPADHDVLYCGDDIKFLKEGTVERLQRDAYNDERIGIISPRLIGRASPTLANPPEGVSYVRRPIEMWFPCVYIKREVIEKIGYLDEQFSGFGSDDLDFCVRALMAGYKFAVTSNAVVAHGASPEGGPTTFCKNLGAEEWQRQEEIAYNKIRTKWSTSPQDFQKFLGTGDCNYLNDGSVESPKSHDSYEDGLLCKKEDAEKFLQTRILYVATPAYGGWLSVNYVSSLNALINLCHNLNVRYITSFVYNESLITRARNKMAGEFLDSNATDFFFIDADIGFDPRDVLMLMLRSEDIIGSPCVRKNLRLDRIVSAVRRNGREYTVPELEFLTGEYVFNFKDAKQSINLGQMIEVMDVGTGLMRVRRETFDKYIKAYPNNWYLPMRGEEQGRKPTYMFFQAGIDEDMRTSKEGYPDYIPEDYWFCRQAIKAGMKVWLAPWLKTTHMGSYMFKGDLEAVAKAGGVLR